MNTDYTYCLSTDCIHRRGCKRAWINYSSEEKSAIFATGRLSTLVDTECIKSKPYPYANLDRFRYSDGREIGK